MILPPLHLICQIAVLLVLTVLDPACPLSMDGETATEKKKSVFSWNQIHEKCFWKHEFMKTNNNKNEHSHDFYVGRDEVLYVAMVQTLQPCWRQLLWIGTICPR